MEYFVEGGRLTGTGYLNRGFIAIVKLHLMSSLIMSIAITWKARPSPQNRQGFQQRRSDQLVHPSVKERFNQDANKSKGITAQTDTNTAAPSDTPAPADQSKHTASLEAAADEDPLAAIAKLSETMSDDDIAEHLGVSRSTVLRYRKERGIEKPKGVRQGTQRSEYNCRALAKAEIDRHEVGWPQLRRNCRCGGKDSFTMRRHVVLGEEETGAGEGEAGA